MNSKNQEVPEPPSGSPEETPVAQTKRKRGRPKGSTKASATPDSYRRTIAALEKENAELKKANAAQDARNRALFQKNGVLMDDAKFSRADLAELKHQNELLSEEVAQLRRALAGEPEPDLYEELRVAVIEGAQAILNAPPLLPSGYTFVEIQDRARAEHVLATTPTVPYGTNDPNYKPLTRLESMRRQRAQDGAAEHFRMKRAKKR